jgi:hypothetical protein
MSKETLDSLKEAFKNWRVQKKFLREKIPDDLLRRAKNAATIYGIDNVVNAVQMKRYYFDDILKEKKEYKKHNSKQKRPDVKKIPIFSQIDLTPPHFTPSQPIMEIEKPNGTKLRLFTLNSEIMNCISEFYKSENNI